MDQLIIEVMSRHGSHFHLVDRPVTRIGRALDNDIIVSDPTVSAYHCVVRQRADGIYELLPLAEENGVYRGRRKIEEPLELIGLPVELDAGHTRLKILDRATQVAPTRLISCRGNRGCLFGSWSWALVLLMLFVMLSGLENYLSTHQRLTWDSYWADQVLIVGTALGMAMMLTVIARLVAHRWDLPAAISFVSLALSFIFIVDYGITFANYFFSSNLPAYVANLVILVVLLPLASAWFFVRVHHAHSILSWIFIVLFLTPATYLQAKDIAAYYNLFDVFSAKAFYNRSLYPWDVRLQTKVDIGEFINNTPLTRKPAAE